MWLTFCSMMWMLCLEIKLFKIKNMALMMITSCHKCICLGTPRKFASEPKVPEGDKWVVSNCREQLQRFMITKNLFITFIS